MNLATKIAVGAGIVGVGALTLAACAGPKEQDAESKLLKDFQKFDRSPRDNEWTQSETSLFEVGRPYSTNRYDTYRVGDMQFWEQQIVHRETTSDMDRLFAAAKGNDAVASLAELKSVALRFDKDGNGTLSRTERKDFDSQFGPSVRTRTILDRVETGWSYVRDYPDPNYPGNGGGNTSPGDDGGYDPGYNPGNGGGNTSPGDDGGGYTPPSNGGGTSPGDGGGYTPPSSGNGNSTDNGNPGEDDF